MNKILHQFSKSASAYDMTFSSQEILKNSVIGWDGLHRKLLVLTGYLEENSSVQMIDLHEVKSCTLKKQYGMIKGGAKPVQNLEAALERIDLNFAYKDEREPVAIPFYQRTVNKTSELKDLEQKARHWETLFSKMLKTASQKIA